jgi:DNA-binding GntR family transcriptional regulator
LNSDRAYDFIRERILNGEFPPGHALMTNVLSTAIGVSRTPVRDALRQLEADGLVIIRPRLGASVKTMDLKEFRELCGLRLALESYAAGLAAQHRTEADLHEIAFALESLRSLTDRYLTGDQEQPMLSELVREDVRFHIAIMTAARNDLIKKEILRLHLINRVVSGPSPKARDALPSPLKAEKHDHMRAVQAEHEKIYDTIKRGDTAAAEDAMEKHLQSVVENSLRTMARAENRLIAKELTKEELNYIT